MTVDIMEKLKEHGWYITEQGYDIVSDTGCITDAQKIIKRLLDIDLKEVGSGQGDIAQGNIVLQIQKLRNVAATKSNEESKAAPRMLKLSLTDGKNNFQAVEVDHVSSLSLNTPPGTKILLKSGNILMAHGMILLTPSYILQVLGGKVTNLVEKWELNKKLALHTRVRSTDEGGPPPWIPFGKKIVKVSEQDKNFKSLSEKDKASKENAEFEAQRKDAIAEAAKQGSKKIFGGGNKQLLDHSVQRIVDQGFSIEQAEYALRVNRNNVERALKSLQKADNKNNVNKEPREREPREPRSKRFEKKSDETKPSTGKISLFDFLEDKLPVQTDSVDTSHSAQSNYTHGAENTYDKVDLRSGDTHVMRGGRSQKGGRVYQAPPRHQEENKNSKRLNSNSSGSSQYQQYNGISNTQSKPPRFQRNQDTHGYYQVESSVKTYPKAQSSDYRNSNPQSRTEAAGNTNVVGQYQRSQDQPGKTFANSKTYNHLEGDARNKHDYDTPPSRHNRAQKDGPHKAFPANTNDKNFKNQMNRYQPNDNSGGRGAMGPNRQRSEQHFSNNQNANNSQVGGTWVWRIGDKCLAKYWEDNRYYSAEVTDVSDRTCVVQFKGFKNYEEVLQIDCIPYTDDQQLVEDSVETRRPPDQRYNNRQQPQFDQGYNHINVGMEFRRGGNMPPNKSYGKKRPPQRTAQPIYQPPAQRNQGSMSMNT